MENTTEYHVTQEAIERASAMQEAISTIQEYVSEVITPESLMEDIMKRDQVNDFQANLILYTRFDEVLSDMFRNPRPKGMSKDQVQSYRKLSEDKVRQHITQEEIDILIKAELLTRRDHKDLISSIVTMFHEWDHIIEVDTLLAEFDEELKAMSQEAYNDLTIDVDVSQETDYPGLLRQQREIVLKHIGLI